MIGSNHQGTAAAVNSQRLNPLCAVCDCYRRMFTGYYKIKILCNHHFIFFCEGLSKALWLWSMCNNKPSFYRLDISSGALLKGIVYLKM